MDFWIRAIQSELLYESQDMMLESINYCHDVLCGISIYYFLLRWQRINFWERFQGGHWTEKSRKLGNNQKFFENGNNCKLRVHFSIENFHIIKTNPIILYETIFHKIMRVWIYYCKYSIYQKNLVKTKKFF